MGRSVKRNPATAAASKLALGQWGKQHARYTGNRPLYDMATEDIRNAKVEKHKVRKATKAKRKQKHR